MNKKSSILKDPELWFVILFNLLLIFSFFYSNYDGRFAVWGYFLQSVFIGFEYVSISLAKIYKKDRSFMPLSKLSLIGFFTMHFGLFHFVYFIFLISSIAIGGDPDSFVSLFKFVRVTIVYLLINSIVLIGRELMPKAPDYPKPSIVAAYIRILPIHLFIMINSFSGDINPIAFVVFMGLKLGGDLLIYVLFNRETELKKVSQ